MLIFFCVLKSTANGTQKNNEKAEPVKIAPINDPSKGIPDPTDGVGPIPMAFLLWPH